MFLEKKITRINCSSSKRSDGSGTVSGIDISSFDMYNPGGYIESKLTFSMILPINSSISVTAQTECKTSFVVNFDFIRISMSPILD